MKRDIKNTNKVLSDAAKTLNPVKLFTGLYWNIFVNRKRAVISLIYLAGCMYSIFLVLMAAAKLIFPDSTGFFLIESRGLYLGFLADTAGTQDLLGYWFIPLSLICGVILYLILAKSIRFVISLEIMNRLFTRLEIYKYSAHILAIFWAGFWAYFGLASGIVEELSLTGVLVYTAVPGLIFFIPVLVSWKWENIGGILLVLTGIAVSIFYIFIIQKPQWLYVIMPVMAFPPVIAGTILSVVSAKEHLIQNKKG
ncbi:hypothetical protein ACFL4T_14420 [candidate division KSB1 bacterium]